MVPGLVNILKLLKAMENDHRNTGLSHFFCMVIVQLALYVCLPEGIERHDILIEYGYDSAYTARCGRMDSELARP